MIDKSKESLTAYANAIASREHLPCREVRFLEISKVDAANKSIKLADAEFELYEVKNGKQQDKPLQTIVTDGKGKARSEELDLGGKYVLVEKKAPSGYVRNEKPISVVVSDLDEGEAVITLEVTNEKEKPATPHKKNTGKGAPKTGDGANGFAYSAVLGLSLLGVALLVAGRKKLQKK